MIGLPRSRTAWLSRFLTYGDWVCGHEELRHMRSFGDISAWFSQPCIGTAETAIVPWWRLFGRFAPDARIVVVRRPVAEVVDSMMCLPGFAVERSVLQREMGRLDRKLDQIEARLPCLSVRFDDLANEATCAAVFEHCLGLRHDPAHWALWAPINVQCDMRALARYVGAYRPAMEKLAKIARQQTLVAMAVCDPIPADGITLQVEPFETWLRDAGPLFDEHLVQVGEAPGDWRTKNIPLMRSMDALGMMQIMTARCNGRLFGYLQTIIGPSLTKEGITVGSHGTFYADPSFPGLGLKLQRAALTKLKAKGVSEVFMQDGVRGSGGRINTIYRRLGAQDDGQVYRLQLSEV